MPFPQLARTVQGRATAQAGGNTETRQATVKKTYGDGSGNILFADVRLPGQTADLVHVPNRTTLKLAVNDQVTLNFVQGQSHYPQIVGAAGGGTASAANAQSAADSGANVPPVVPQDFSSAPVLLQSPTALAPSGYVEAPGANVLFTDTPPGTGSGGAVNGQRLITMRPLVSTSLPNPLTTTLPDGTLLDLVDSYSNPLGMYRLDAVNRVWRRRDVGSAGSTFTLLPATASTLGGVKIGANVLAAADGTISVAFPVTSVAGRTGAVTLSTGDISGLGSAATYSASAFDGAGAAATAQAASLQKSANLSDLASAGTARTNLGLGTAAVLNAPASGNASSAQVVLGSDTRLGGSGFTPQTVLAPNGIGVMYVSGPNPQFTPYYSTTVQPNGIRFEWQCVLLTTGTTPTSSQYLGPAGTNATTDYWSGDSITAGQGGVPALTTGNVLWVQVRARADYAQGGTVPSPSGWVTLSGGQAYVLPLLKRRVLLKFVPNGTTVDTVPNIGQKGKVPYGTAEVSTNWKVIKAYLDVDGTSASPTSVQLYYAPGGNVAFGSGTAMFSATLTDSGTSNEEAVTTSFTGTLSTVGLPSWTNIAPLFSALGGTMVALFVSLEEV